MANQKHLNVLKQGVKAWNQWREEHRDIRPDLPGADLPGADLIGANLSYAKLSYAKLSYAKLWKADLSGAVRREVT